MEETWFDVTHLRHAFILAAVSLESSNLHPVIGQRTWKHKEHSKESAQLQLEPLENCNSKQKRLKIHVLNYLYHNGYTNGLQSEQWRCLNMFQVCILIKNIFSQFSNLQGKNYFFCSDFKKNRNFLFSSITKSYRF